SLRRVYAGRGGRGKEARVSILPPKHRSGIKARLFVAEGIDRVEAGGFPGGVDAGGEAQCGGHKKSRNDPCERKLRGHMRAIFHKQRETRTEYDADNSAYGTQGDGFDQKLNKYVAAFCADGFANADLTSSFRDADQHDVHDADSADK